MYLNKRWGVRMWRPSGWWQKKRTQLVSSRNVCKRWVLQCLRKWLCSHIFFILFLWRLLLAHRPTLRTFWITIVKPHVVQKAHKISRKCLEIMHFSYSIDYNELYVTGFAVILSTEYFVATFLWSGFGGCLLAFLSYLVDFWP